MKLRLFIVALLALGLAWKLTSSPREQKPVAISPLEQVQAKGNVKEDEREYLGTPTVELSTNDSSAENLSALQYVKKYARHYCSPNEGWMLSCSFKNRGDREIASFVVEIRASSRTLDTVDTKDAQYKPYRLEVQGPFPPHVTRYAKVKMPTEEGLQWVSTRSTVVSAAY